jgi:hypothetical protein
MNDFEDELRSRLAARASAVSVESDWADLTDRMGRSARRASRALFLVLTLTLCVSAVAVVIAVHSAGHGSQAATPIGKARPTSPVDRVVATHAAVPTISAANGQSLASSKGLVGSPNNNSGPLYSKQTQLSPLINGGTQSSGTAWVPYSGPYASMAMARVFTRTTAGGVTIRAYRANVAPTSAVPGPPWWTPPGWCYPNGYVQADMSDNAVAGVGFAPLFAAQQNGSKVGGTLSVIGQNEQAVRWIVVAQGPTEAATLRASFPDGSRDAMAPVGGVAVLVGHGKPDLKDAKVTVAALDASGGTIATRTIAALAEPVPYDAECNAPQKLPAPGAHQPVDAATARQAVIDTFNNAYAKGVNDDATFAYFDDSHGFADIMAKLRTGTFKEQVRTAVLKLDDLVFLSPTEAAVQYEIDIPNYGTPSFAPRFNEAHLIDGKWKLARQGFCTDVGLAGVQCPP